MKKNNAKTPIKRINFRPAVSIFAAFAAGVLAFYGAIFSSGAALIVSAALAAAVIITVFVCRIKNFMLTLALIAAVFLLGGATMYFQVLNISGLGTVPTQQTTVFGKVSMDSYYSDTYAYIVLRDAEYINENGARIKLKSDITLFVTAAFWPTGDGSAPSDGGQFDINAREYFQLGYYISAECTLSPKYIFADGVDTYAYRANCLYEASDVTRLSRTAGEPLLREKLQLYIKDNLNLYMGNEDNAAIASGVLIGDTALIPQEDKESFRVSGLLHLFSVSGLHIGFLLTILSFALKRTRLSGVAAVLIVFLPALFYGWLCGFAPPIVRALIMSFITVMARYFGTDTDLCTSLSISALIILLFRPLYIFDAGFLLSFGTMVGIATFSQTVSRPLVRSKMPAVIKNTLQGPIISLGATLGSLPVAAYFFGSLPLYGIILNAIFIPLFTVAVIFLFIGVLPLPAVGYLLVIPNAFLTVTRTVLKFCASLPFAEIPFLYFGIIGALAVYILLYFCGGFVNIKKIAKAVLISVSALAVVVSCIFAWQLPAPQNTYFVPETKTPCIAATDQNGSAVAVAALSGLDEFYFLLQFFNAYKTNSSALVLYSREADAVLLNLLLEGAQIDAVYLLSGANGAAADVLSACGVAAIRNKTEFYAGGIYVQAIETHAYRGVKVCVGSGVAALICSAGAAVCEVGAPVLPGIDIIFSPLYAAEFARLYPASFVLTSLPHRAEFTALNIYSTRKFGGFTIDVFNDRITLRS